MMNASDTNWDINPSSYDYLKTVFDDPYTLIEITTIYEVRRKVSYDHNGVILI